MRLFAFIWIYEFKVKSFIGIMYKLAFESSNVIWIVIVISWRSAVDYSRSSGTWENGADE